MKDHYSLARALRIEWHQEHLVKPMSNQNTTKQGKSIETVMKS